MITHKYVRGLSGQIEVQTEIRQTKIMFHITDTGLRYQPAGSNDTLVHPNGRLSLSALDWHRRQIKNAIA